MKHRPIPEFLDKLNMLAEDHLHTAVSVFQKLSEEELRRPSSTGGWSIAQCLEHLNSYGVYYLPQIKRVILNSKASGNSNYENGWLGGYFIKMMQPNGKKFKAVRSHNPQPELDAPEVIATFIKQQEELIGYIRQAAKADLSGRIAMSIGPVVRLKLGDILEFIVVHNARHMQQALRNLSGEVYDSRLS